MILGIVRPACGTVRLFGKLMSDDHAGIRRKIGVVCEFQHFYRDMTGEQYLGFFSDIYNVPCGQNRIAELLDRLNLLDKKDVQISAYSKGMQQKLAFARALLHMPELLVLDEPVSSLDPYGIRQVREMILEENARGTTVLMSSHLLSEVEKTCHRMGIMSRGELVIEDTLDNVREKLGAHSKILIETDRDCSELSDAIMKVPGVAAVESSGRSVLVTASSKVDLRAELSRLISQSGFTLISLERREMDLEDAFVSVTQDSGNIPEKEETRP
jgi:ABC-2 type transport system ATP-binding protein